MSLNTVENLALAEEIAEKLRNEPYRLFTNNCLTKSIRFVKECKTCGIKARLVWCLLGLVKAELPLIGKWIVPCFIHFWGEVEGNRFETSRPLGEAAFWGIIPSEIKPVIKIKF